MDWVKLWTTIHDDPGMLRLSDKAFRYYLNAWSWSGKHDTDGEFEVFGKHPKCVAELVAAGKFEPTDDPDRFLIHGWGGRQVTAEQAAARSAAASAAASARWSAERNASRIAKRSPNRNAEKSRGDKTREEKPIAPRERDALFEAVAEACGINWAELTDSSRGALNKALAMLRGVDATPDEVRRRAASWPYEVPLTPTGLAKHWPALGTKTDDRALRLLQASRGTA